MMSLDLLPYYCIAFTPNFRYNHSSPITTRQLRINACSPFSPPTKKGAVVNRPPNLRHKIKG
ncbi:hypothetical protein [Moraxella lacunata]|uniref:hypothetical protein n=1 Tax=Moraxella lacunata TaxID=477 RepID=UPI003EDF4161